MSAFTPGCPLCCDDTCCLNRGGGVPAMSTLVSNVVTYRQTAAQRAKARVYDARRRAKARAARAA